MHLNKVAIFASCLVSSVLITTAIKMSSHDTYKVAAIEETKELPSFESLSKVDRKEVECLARNIYHEAAFEPKDGWKAVASVTLNRVLSGNYADSICGVVYQNNGKVYQFSWVGMKNRLSAINEKVYNEILSMATHTYFTYETSNDITNGATFYHADYVNPRWKLERVDKIGRHIFYRSKKDMQSLGVI